MKYKAFLAVLFVFGLAFAETTHAQTVDTIDTSSAVIISETVDIKAQKLAELADLKAKIEDPATTTFAKFFIHLKIRQLENELNIKKALQ